MNAENVEQIVENLRSNEVRLTLSAADKILQFFNTHSLHLPHVTGFIILFVCFFAFLHRRILLIIAVHSKQIDLCWTLIAC
jgi:hypothetical protein